MNIVERVRPYTMVSDTGVQFAIDCTLETIDQNIPGDIVECGTWRGGCAMAMMLAQADRFGRVKRPVHFFDSFAGLPPAQEIDGRAAQDWQRQSTDNCVASRDGVEQALHTFGFVAGEYVIHEGPFFDTMRDFSRPIALLRLDCDWHASVRWCLNRLYDRVSYGATIIIDDYFAWDGCTRAVHSFLSSHDLPLRIVSLPDKSSAYMVKEYEAQFRLRK